MDSDLLYLRPDQILIDPEILDARPLYDPDTEIDAITQLAQSMILQSQLEPVVVWPVMKREGLEVKIEYHLIAGRRRVDAAYWINASKGPAEDPFLLKAVVNTEVEDKFRAAITENIERKDLTVMEIAFLIRKLRGMGMNGTAAGEYLGLNKSNISRYEKLFELSEDIQLALHRGEMSMRAALELTEVWPEAREEVLDEARRQAEGEEVPTYLERRERHPRKRLMIEQMHIREAARMVEVFSARKARSRQEIMNMFEMLAANRPWVRQFVTTLEEWARGNAEDTRLRIAFDRMLDDHQRHTVTLEDQTVWK